MYKEIYTCLKNNGIDVYSVGQHKGDCLSKYVVVKPSGSNRISVFSSDMDYYDLLLYVPEDKFSTLEDFVREVKQVMKQLLPIVKENHFETPSFHDDTNKSHMWSIQYRAPRKFN